MAGDDLTHFSFRELLGHRARAERAVRRGRNPSAATVLIARIDAELDRRRARLFARRGAGAPDLERGPTR
ncbi:MAG: hypothetical protein AAGC56_00645 [Pseudomonadota bacterium]